MDDVVLRAADSAGAPAALTQPLPRGVEVTLLERRDALDADPHRERHHGLGPERRRRARRA